MITLAMRPWVRYGSLVFVVSILFLLFLYPGNTNIHKSNTFIPPSTTALSKTIVVGKTQAENTTWVVDELSDWQNAIYTVDSNPNNNNASSLRTTINKSREATPYLTYILAHYDNLTDITLFLHSHRDGAWHVDNNEDHSNVQAAQQLRLDHVQQQGFVNLRCGSIPGCDGAVQLHREDDDDAPPPRADHPVEQAMPKAWKEMFPDVEMPMEIGAACCAQFAVTRQQVRKRSREEYELYYKWVTTTELTDPVSGRVMEYLWHIIFGMDSVHCPDQEQCYCDVYGRC